MKYLKTITEMEQSTLKNAAEKAKQKYGNDFQPCAFSNRKEANRFIDYIYTNYKEEYDKIIELGEFSVNSILTESPREYRN
jgi:hypothetical protein